MQTSDQARTLPAQPGTRRRTHHGRWRFLRHYLEMVAAMLVGMMVLGAALRGVLALTGLRYPAQYPELAALEMASTMFVLMFVLMLRRRAEYGGAAHG